MRTYVAFFTYWAPRSHGRNADWPAPSESDFSADNANRKDDPHFLVSAACAENQSVALEKFRSLLLHLCQTDVRHEVLPSGAAVHLNSLFDLIDVSGTAAVLDCSAVTTLDEGARFFPGITVSPRLMGKELFNLTQQRRSKSNPVKVGLSRSSSFPICAEFYMR